MLAVELFKILEIMLWTLVYEIAEGLIGCEHKLTSGAQTGCRNWRKEEKSYDPCYLSSAFLLTFYYYHCEI